MSRKTLMTSVFVAMALTVFITGCSDDSTSPQSPLDYQNDVLSTEELKAALELIPVGDPGEVEIADLNFMREEEKLAYDVYTDMFGRYGLTIFSKIAGSEQKHTDAVMMLLDRFGLEDPVGDNGPGVFTNQDLQALYDDLIESGSLSLADGLLAGLAIEEIDILDLVDTMSRTELPEILKVYGNLLNGSYNHLRAFVATYERETGEVYAPRWLSQEAYDEILSGGSGRGHRGHRKGDCDR